VPTNTSSGHEENHVIVEEYNIMWKLIESFYVLRTIAVLHDGFC